MTELKIAAEHSAPLLPLPAKSGWSSLPESHMRLFFPEVSTD